MPMPPGPPRPPRPMPPRPPRPPHPRPHRPFPTPFPIPLPVPIHVIPGHVFRPINVYRCRIYDDIYRSFLCKYVATFADAAHTLPFECRTFIAGPFMTIQEADRYIERAFNVERDQWYFCD